MKTIIEEFRKLETSDKKIKEFGLFVGFIFSCIAGFLFWKQIDIYLVLLGVGVFLMTGAFLFRRLLRPIYQVWMGLALVMGFIVSKIILGILYFLIMTPVSVVAKITRTCFLKMKKDPSVNTYWNERDSKPDKKSYSQQY